MDSKGENSRSRDVTTGRRDLLLIGELARHMKPCAPDMQPMVSPCEPRVNEDFATSEEPLNLGLGSALQKSYEGGGRCGEDGGRCKTQGVKGNTMEGKGAISLACTGRYGE